MGDDLRLRDRAAVRTPMQWSAEPNGGFSTAERVVRRVVSGGDYGFESVNVEQQRRDPDSLLRWMIRMIRVRKECPEIGLGDPYGYRWFRLGSRNEALSRARTG